MSLEFVQNFEAAGRRIQLRQWIAAVCWTLAGVAAAALALALVDRWLGVYHLAARVLLTVLFVTATAVVLLRATRRVGDRKSPLEVALLLEDERPELRSLLASGVEFTGQDPGDVTAGSPELRRGVVLRAALASDQVDFSAVAARRAPTGKAIAAAAIALAAVGVATVREPRGAAIGVTRLVNPFSDVEWPRLHDLTFVDAPSVVALGGDFRVKLRDRRGALPANVVVEYRSRRQGRWHYDSQRYAAGESSLDVMWPNVQGPFEFRARGGDHRTMPWRPVAAAKAPQVYSLLVTMLAPAYTHWPAEMLDEPFRVLRGSELELIAQATEPVASGQLEAKGQPPIALVISDDGRKISLARGKWRPTTTAEWTFRLTTPGGLTIAGTRPMRIEVAEDMAPMAAIVEPVEELSLLPTARINLMVEATDDVGLNDVSLAVQEVDAPAATANVVETELFRAKPSGASQKPVLETFAQHSLALSTVDPRPGASWEICAKARDVAGHESRSQPPLRVRVITYEQFISHVERELARVRAALESAYDNQRDALRRIEAWRADDVSLNWPKRDQGLAALAQQRNTGQPLAGGQDAAASVLEGLLGDYRRNGLTANDDVPRLERLQLALDALTRESLPAIENLLAQFVRQVDLGNRQSTDGKYTVRLLEDTEARQNESLAVIDAALTNLSRWSQLHPYRREIAKLKTDQAAVRDETEAVARSAIERIERPSMAPARERETAAIVTAQRELAARLARVLGRMRQSLTGHSPGQSADGARLAAALEAAETAGVRLTALAAADHLDAARFGQAVDAQSDVDRGLQEILDCLAGSDTRDASQRLAELKAAEQQIESAREKTEALGARQETAERAENADQSELNRIKQERNKIAESVQKLTKRLEGMTLPAATEAARRAEQNLTRGAPSSTSDRRAADELQQAKQALTDARRQQQALLAQLQMQQLEAALQTLASDQQEVIQRLAQERLAVDDVVEIAGLQARVRKTTGEAADRLKSVPVFARSLRAAADDMRKAEIELTAGNAGDTAMRPATEALRQLELLADAIGQQQQASPPPGPSPSQSPPAGGAAPQNQAQNAAQARMLQLAIAQLTVLRKMQAGLESQTAKLEQSFAAGELSKTDLSARTAGLAAEQRDLAELAASVMRDADLPPIDEEYESP